MITNDFKLMKLSNMLFYMDRGSIAFEGSYEEACQCEAMSEFLAECLDPKHTNRQSSNNYGEVVDTSTNVINSFDDTLPFSSLKSTLSYSKGNTLESQLAGREVNLGHVILLIYCII